MFFTRIQYQQHLNLNYQREKNGEKDVEEENSDIKIDAREWNGNENEDEWWEVKFFVRAKS